MQLSGIACNWRRSHRPVATPYSEVPSKHGASPASSPGDPASTAVQGQLVSEMRYLASVVTQCFTAFGELLGMQKRFAELSGGVTRVSELGGTLRAAAAQEATIRNIAAADDITRASRFCAHVATRHLPSRASQANRTAIS